jgi:hypothetical protein
MNTTPSTLIQLLLSLLSDPEAAAAFQQDPAAFVAQCGLTDLTPEQVHDAAVLVADQDPPAPEHHDKPHHHTPPPAPEPHDPPHEAAIKYLNTYVTNNWIDDRDTTIDNSVNQKIDTGGGDFTQTIDNHTTVASGDGAVAAGGDITDSTLVTGDHNTLGDGNVTGSDNTLAFGDGDATSTSTGGDLSVGDGGAFSNAGAAAANNADSSTHDSGNVSTDGSVHDSGNDTSDHSVNDSNNSAYDIDSSSHDSATTTTDASLHHVDNVDVHPVAP